MTKEEIHRELFEVFYRTGRQTFRAECAENALTTCKGFLKLSGPAMEHSPSVAVPILAYDQGWRCVSYPGYESFTCPACLESLRSQYGSDLVVSELGGRNGDI